MNVITTTNTTIKWQPEYTLIAFVVLVLVVITSVVTALIVIGTSSIVPTIALSTLAFISVKLRNISCNF